jgi:hypothetical protein
MCGDGRLRTLLYEPANVMLTRYSGSLALKKLGARHCPATIGAT